MSGRAAAISVTRRADEQLERMVAPAEGHGQNARTGEATYKTDRQRLYHRYPELERVDRELESLFFDTDYSPVMYHSGHRRDAWNDFAVKWFDDGFANTMLSVISIRRRSSSKRRDRSPTTRAGWRIYCEYRGR
jgi:hypothetical protein